MEFIWFVLCGLFLYLRKGNFPLSLLMLDDGPALSNFPEWSLFDSLARSILMLCRKTLFRTTFLALLLLLSGGVCHRKTTPPPMEGESPARSPSKQRETLARETYQEDYEILYNTDKTVALVRKSIDPGGYTLYPTIYFFLYDLKSATVLYKDTAPRAEVVQWIGADEVLVRMVAGQFRDESAGDFQEGYIYNVRERTKRPLGKNQR